MMREPLQLQPLAVKSRRVPCETYCTLKIHRKTLTTPREMLMTSKHEKWNPLGDGGGGKVGGLAQRVDTRRSQLTTS